MKKLILLLILLPSLALADSWPWVPTGRSGIKPAGDKVIEREYPVAATGSLPTTQMSGDISNRGATGTIEIRLQTPSGYRSFLINEVEGQTLEVDFPTDVNPYLNGAQIGANHELVIPAGGVIRVVYDPEDTVWKCFMVWLATTEKADD